MLLEVRSEDGSGSTDGSDENSSFICSVSVHLSVQIAVEHVARVHSLRTQLAAAVALARAEPGPSGEKRAHDAEAIAEATALLSPLAVSRKNVLTVERLEAALAALSSGVQTQPPPRPGGRLFFAGKWLEAEKPMSEYVGSNDKSKVKVVFGGHADGHSAAQQPAPVASIPAAPPPASMVEQPAASSLEAPAAEAERQEAPAAEPERKKVRLAEVEDRGVSLSAFYKQQGGGAPSGGDEPGGADGTEDDEEMPVLTERQAELLVLSRDVRVQLRDPRLQELLRHIDSASTREGALRRLEQALDDPDFEEFSRTTLREIGLLGEEEPPRAP